ncbi:uncharacterized protein MYCFIDRAFT_84502 [Pseudocercospora fijiensis CIRAD86]|uniref:Uncharacterized protein n=1 Tax=Pseudocercospora fijiensis (strain CIRAD86) TaxID=383855 RepID=M3AP38_PSEFD|nr:uncharacterized protein MYCFIDRAFT_84502 [Pseudocercospora fijiensis CIRAD86]EME86356.1 hypothetical protein MYCFIDRAFT_84502 [Pseudocercospora fijiensis CIRAD86]
MSRSIEEPYVIATLPKPFDAENGRTHTGLVHSLNGSRKRKRHEIVVAVDGESVNIYHVRSMQCGMVSIKRLTVWQVQNQSTTRSYALPPQSYLAAAPCSIHCKRPKPRPSQRRTYWAERSSITDQKAKIVSYVEDTSKWHGNENQPRAPIKRERKLGHGDVQSLDVIPSSEEKGSASPLLVSYKSGSVECISADLSGTRWEHKSEDQVEVEHSLVTDLDSVRRGLLRGREDIQALLESLHTEGIAESAPAILCQVVRLQDRRQVRIHALKNVGSSALQSQRSPIQEAVRYDLPGTFVPAESRFELNAPAGTLHQHSKGRLTVFDLSGTLPKMVFQNGRPGQRPVDTFARLSSASVLTASQHRLAVHDTKYGSVLSSLELSRDRDGVQTQSSLRFIVSFTDLGIVTALRGHDLLAMQVGHGLEDVRRSRNAGPLLLDVLGKGKYLSEKVDSTETNEKRRRKWESWVSKVDHFLEHEDIEGLEKLVAKDLHLHKKGEDKERMTNGHANGDSPVHLAPWALLPKHYDPQHIDHKKAVYILGKIFAWRTIESHLEIGQKHLELILASRNILAWLALAGYLTAPEIEHALPRTAAGFHSQPHVLPGDIAYAIGDADASFDLLCNLFSLPAFWELPEVVQAIKVLIDSFEEKDEARPQQLLTNGDIDMVDGDDAEKSEVQLEAEEAAAMREIERANNLMDAGVTRSTAFRKCLVRLQQFDHKDVSGALRAQMSQTEIIFLIQIMRVELANGGWTFTYDGIEDSAIGIDPSAQELSLDNQGIRTIAQLISCAVDAIGLSGWTVGLSGDRFVTDDLLYSLINETSAVMEGMFAAENLETTLKEIERTAASVQQQLQSHKRKRNGPEEQPENASEATLMPLGGRMDPPTVSKTVEARKGKVLTAKQKSQSVGKYSFERIRI